MTLAEADRLRILRSYAVLDTDPDPAFDRITALARAVFDAPIALISLVDETRQWFKSRDGVEACETGRSEAFCAHALPLERGAILVVEDATADPRFAANPLVTGPLHIRFYAGAVLTSPEGASLGTLCVIDTKPRRALTPLQAQTLRALADLVMGEFEVRRARRDDEAKRQLLDLAEAMSGVGHWRLEVATGAAQWSDEVYRIHGVARSAFDPNLNGALDFYDAEGREAVTRHIEAAVRDRSGFSFQLRIRRTDGDWRDVVCRATCEFDAAGAVAALVGVFRDVTDEQALLRRVSEDRERYRLLTENANDMIATSSLDSTILFVTPAVHRLLGYTPEEVVGLKTLDLTHPEDAPAVVELFTRLVKAGPSAEVAPYQFRGRRKDGRWMWLEGQPRVRFDDGGRPLGFQDVVRDISARKAAQEEAAAAARLRETALAAAQESEARYRLLAENATDMISCYGLDGRIRYVSPASTDVIGFTPEELLGRSTLEMIHADDVARIRGQFATYLAAPADAPPIQTEHRVTCKDGDIIWLEGRPKLVRDAGGRPVEYQDVMRDVTARKALESELQAARLAAEDAARAKADFLANMSHELRTPLTSILGYTALASEQAELSALTRDYVRRVQNASRALLGTVNDILDFSKLEAGQVSVTPVATDVLAVCRDAIELFTPEAAAKDLRLAIESPGQAPPTVLIDPERLLQLLLNLVGNAVKFTEAGSVVVVVRHTRAGLTLEIRDTGCGIPADGLDRLFKRFSQVDGSSTRSHGGTGLGLAICRGLAERMGGAIAVASEVGAGSTFTLTLPAPRAASPPAASATGPGALQQLEALRILVVDDNAANRDLARIVLAGAGAEASEASSGLEALQVLATQPFDAVLLDLRMPDLDGAAVLHRLRGASGPNDAIPVIAYTADAPEPGRLPAGAAAFDGVVHKPISPAELLAAVKRAVDGEDATEGRRHAR